MPKFYQRKLGEKLKNLKSHSPSDSTYKPPQLLIKSSNPKKNFYLRSGRQQDHFPFNRLASFNWTSLSSVGEYFVVQRMGGHPAWLGGDRSGNAEPPVGWNALGIANDSEVGALLSDLKFKKPTLIQQLMIAPILRGDNAICVGETGGGKTLAYLLPLLHQLVRARGKVESSSNDKWNGPSVVVLIPIAILREQFLNVATVFCQKLNLNVSQFLEDQDRENELKRFQEELALRKPDILTLTPAALLRALNADILNAASFRHLVFDEADFVLSERTQTPTLKEIFRHIPIQSSPEVGDGCQTVFVSATLPAHVETTLKEIVPMEKFEKIHSPFAHRVLQHINQVFMRVKEEDKLATLLTYLLKKERIPCSIIFCSRKQNAIDLSARLLENNVENRLLIGSMDLETRSQALNDISSGKVRILVTTDMAANGLDLLHLSRVINYDTPNFLADYLHRMGRVGRVGSEEIGEVVSLISKKYEVKLVQQIEHAIRSGRQLDTLGADRDSFLNQIELKRKNADQTQPEI